MPPTTDLGISYPCSGGQIAASDFNDNASSAQAALLSTDALVTQALRPEGAQLRCSAQVVAAGATTTISYTSEVYDRGGLWSPAAPTQVVLVSGGTYLVSYGFFRSVFPTTLTSMRTAILLGGVEVAYKKNDAGALAGGASNSYWVTAMLPGLAAGNIITTTQLFTGSGNMTTQSFLTIIKIANV